MYPETLSRIVNSSKISEEDKNLLEYWLGQIKKRADSDSDYAEGLRGIYPELWARYIKQRGSFLKGKSGSDLSEEELVIEETADFILKNHIIGSGEDSDLREYYSKTANGEQKSKLANDQVYNVVFNIAMKALDKSASEESQDAIRKVILELPEINEEMYVDLLNQPDGKKLLAKWYAGHFKLEGLNGTELTSLISIASEEGSEGLANLGEDSTDFEKREGLIEHYFSIRLRELTGDELGASVRRFVSEQLMGLREIAEVKEMLDSLATANDCTVRRMIAGFKYAPSMTLVHLANDCRRAGFVDEALARNPTATPLALYDLAVKTMKGTNTAFEVDYNPILIEIANNSNAPISTIWQMYNKSGEATTSYIDYVYQKSADLNVSDITRKRLCEIADVIASIKKDMNRPRDNEKSIATEYKQEFVKRCRSRISTNREEAKTQLRQLAQVNEQLGVASSQIGLKQPGGIIENALRTLTGGGSISKGVDGSDLMRIYFLDKVLTDGANARGDTRGIRETNQGEVGIKQVDSFVSAINKWGKNNSSTGDMSRQHFGELAMFLNAWGLMPDTTDLPTLIKTEAYCR